MTSRTPHKTQNESTETVNEQSKLFPKELGNQANAQRKAENRKCGGRKRNMRDGMKNGLGFWYVPFLVDYRTFLQNSPSYYLCYIEQDSVISNKYSP